ncbi:hypothetical protein IWQ47_001659 [Aquimarina sp. EL_43]|uniref:hypothetical protein n=1 Tax=Aquimarina TaxID=290174 RepID=UPI000471217D|nr:MULTISPECIES: hypothetical protein [Aquimarina]MBG6130258.1 hypothetical protein [Aquimarina sp. EL_35]MBG6149038.1 hypothetical protein [Aquimarina sp. EL_32]MBG6168588.1 hypothetical protein [Aquimarina sp. EL_43]
MTNFFTHKFRKKSPVEIVGIIIFGAIAITGLAILFGFVIMWLWNWLMPEIFGLTTLTYWQAVGVFILFKILLGGCGSGSSKKSSKDSHDNCKKDSKTDFSKWKYYDKFWKEEGDEYYKQYIERQSNQVQEDTSKPDSE